MNDGAVTPGAEKADVCTFALMVDGKDVSGQFHVLTVEVNREVNRIPTAMIELKDGDSAQATFRPARPTISSPARRSRSNSVTRRRTRRCSKA